LARLARCAAAIFLRAAALMVRFFLDASLGLIEYVSQFSDFH
jgi:hypothetical protein